MADALSPNGRATPQGGGIEMTEFLTAVFAVALSLGLLTACSETRTDRVGERPADRTTPSASPSTAPSAPSATTPPSSGSSSSSTSTDSTSSSSSSPSGSSSSSSPSAPSSTGSSSSSSTGTK